MTIAALALPSPRRARRMIERNLIVYRHVWMVIVSGFFEPLFYLLGIGLGLGSLVPDVGGISYGAFVVPGLLAANCMNGALTDGMFNIYFKLHHEKTYDGILATPMRVADVALGEMAWAVIRGSLYAAAFLVVVVLIGALTGAPLLLSWWAVLALPAAMLVATTFSAMAVCVTTFLRKVQDFDIVTGLGVLPMFLFGGTFFPVAQLPEGVRWVVQVVPMYHAVETLRPLTTGRVDAGILVHVGYLVATGTAAFALAMRRLERALVK